MRKNVLTLKWKWSSDQRHHQENSQKTMATHGYLRYTFRGSWGLMPFVWLRKRLRNWTYLSNYFPHCSLSTLLTSPGCQLFFNSPRLLVLLLPLLGFCSHSPHLISAPFAILGLSKSSHPSRAKWESNLPDCAFSVHHRPCQPWLYSIPGDLVFPRLCRSCPHNVFFWLLKDMWALGPIFQHGLLGGQSWWHT